MTQGKKKLLRTLQELEKECRQCGIQLAKLEIADKLAGKLIDTAGHIQCEVNRISTEE